MVQENGQIHMMILFKMTKLSGADPIVSVKNSKIIKYATFAPFVKVMERTRGFRLCNLQFNIYKICIKISSRIPTIKSKQ
jgi:hypothetical protein